MEPLIWKKVCTEKGWPDVEHGADGKSNFGKGYIAVDEPWRDFLSGCRALTASGVGVVLIAHNGTLHASIPRLLTTYSRYGIKLLRASICSCSPQASDDIVAFCQLPRQD